MIWNGGMKLEKRNQKKCLKNLLKTGEKFWNFLILLENLSILFLGNWDQTGMKEYEWQRVKQNNWPTLINALKNSRDPPFKRRTLENFDIIGYGVVSGPEVPQYKEDKEILTEKELRDRKREYKTKKKKLTSLFQQARNPVIFMPHNVPFNTSLDKITNKESPRYGFHYGSVIARELVEKYQPLLAIGGHMHEHFGKCRIGKTTVINAGFGSEVNTLIDLDEESGKIRSIKFYPKTYG